MKIAHKITQLRRKKGWTQSDLARQAGIPQPTICRLESGNIKDPKMTTLVALSKALGVSLDYLTSPRHGQDLESVIMPPADSVHMDTQKLGRLAGSWADAGILPSTRLGSRGDRRVSKKDVQKLHCPKISKNPLTPATFPC